MLKHYVEYFYPGIMVSETSVKEIPERINGNIGFPERCFGYRFYDVEVIQLPNEELRGKRKNISGMYYCGVEYSAEQIKINFPNERILLSNIRCNSYVRLVKTCMGNWQPLDDDDVVFPEKN